jgi:hypothetical protein
MIRRETITVTGAAGGTGVATANTTSTYILNGLIRAVHLTYTDSPPAGTTDVTIATVATPAVPILSVANAATDAWFYPMNQADNTAGTDITNQGSPVAVDDYVKVTIAQANNDDGVVAVILYEDLSRV